MTRLVYNEGEELFRYIYRNYGTQYFSELHQRVIHDQRRRSKYEFALRTHAGQGVEPSESVKELLKDRDPGEMPPDIARELQNGFEDFMRRAGQSALRNHGDQMTIPRCARCNALLRAPKARQCVWRGHAWFRAA
jgi:hypothetical protein